MNFENPIEAASIDDINRSTGRSQVPDAVSEFLRTNNRTILINNRWAFLI